MADLNSRDDLQPLRDAAVLQEHRFTSRVPVVGGLIAAFRSAWNSISTRWYVAPLLHQQSRFNQMAADQLAEMAVQLDRSAGELAALRDEVATLQEWLINQDREQTQLRHDLGEVTLRVGSIFGCT